MLFDDTYKVLQAASSGEYKDKGSRFLAFAIPVSSEEEAKASIASLKKEHHTAAHHCYAYVTGTGQQLQKSNDDREPSNSAGKPILRAILSHGLTNTLVVVVRYFGGKLLGIPGLITAYGEAAKAALGDATILQKTLCEQFEISFDAAHSNDAYRILKQSGARIIRQVPGVNITLVFELRKSLSPQVIQAIRLNHHLQVKFISEG